MPQWDSGLSSTFNNAYNSGYSQLEEQKKRKAEIAAALLESSLKKYAYTPQEEQQAATVAQGGGVGFPTTREGSAIPNNPIYLPSVNPKTGGTEWNLAPAGVTDPKQIVKMPAPKAPGKSLEQIAAEHKAAAEGDMAGGKEPYGAVRERQNILSALPSKSGQTTPAGAASGVQLAVRQGKGLIAKPGAPQQIALAASDLARAVQRSAPQLDTLEGAGFSKNISTRLSQVIQNLTAKGKSTVDVPDLRKQLFDIFNELESTSKPIIERELRQIERTYKAKGKLPDDWDGMKNDEMGGQFPDIPFQGKDSGKDSGGLDAKKESRYQELLKKQKEGTLKK